MQKSLVVFSFFLHIWNIHISGLLCIFLSESISNDFINMLRNKLVMCLAYFYMACKSVIIIIIFLKFKNSSLGSSRLRDTVKALLPSLIRPEKKKKTN